MAALVQATKQFEDAQRNQAARPAQGADSSWSFAWAERTIATGDGVAEVEDMDDFCEEHRDTRSLYCEDCGISVCRDCALSDQHRGHHFVFIADAQQKYRDELKQQMDDTVGSSAAAVERAMLAGAAAKRSVAEQTEQVVRQIDVFIERQTEALRLRRRELVQEATRLQQEKNGFLDAQQDALASDLRKLCDVAHFVGKAIEMDRNARGTQLLSMKAMLSDRMKECVASAVTPTEPVEGPTSRFDEVGTLMRVVLE